MEEKPKVLEALEEMNDHLSRIRSNTSDLNNVEYELGEIKDLLTEIVKLLKKK